MSDVLRFFVYGTLMEGHGNHRLFGADVADVQRGLVDGYALYSSGIPFAVPEPGSTIVGDIVTIGNELDREGVADLLTRLDRLEGHNPANPDASWYRRIEVAARPLTRGTLLVACWLYMHDEPPVGTVRLDGQWPR